MNTPTKTAAFLAMLALGLAGCHQAPPSAPTTAAEQKQQGQKPSRLAVKRGMDPDMKRVNMSPRDITVEELIAMDRPTALADDISSPEYQDRRIDAFERQVWRLRCQVKSIIRRKDGDFFLVVSGKSGATTVVEVPDPSLCKGSAVEKEISSARSALASYKPGDKEIPINQPATIEGVGFWGPKPKAGGKGAANGARIMPGTGVRMGD